MPAAAANSGYAETQLVNQLLVDAVGRSTENFRQYLVASNASAEKIALLDKLRLRKERCASISECALKLLHLVHEPNHPLREKRKRLFMTVTGYKKNWWKKCKQDYVLETKQHDD
jgi:hypothetical protein